MTPNDVKQKRNVSADAAESAGASCGSGHLPRPAQRPGPEHGCRLAAARIDRRPRAADDARDDGDVEEHVGGEDRHEPALELVRQQLEEGGCDDDRRQHERHEHERPRERAAAEPEPSDRPGEREPGHERERGRERRLPGREPDERRRPVGQRRPPSEVRPRSRIVTSGKTKKSATNASGTSRRRRPARSAQDDPCPLVDPAVAVAPDLGRRQLERLARGDGIAAERVRQRRPLAHRAARTCSRAAPPGSARRA